MQKLPVRDLHKHHGRHLLVLRLSRRIVLRPRRLLLHGLLRWFLFRHCRGPRRVQGMRSRDLRSLHWLHIMLGLRIWLLPNVHGGDVMRPVLKRHLRGWRRRRVHALRERNLPRSRGARVVQKLRRGFYQQVCWRHELFRVPCRKERGYHRSVCVRALPGGDLPEPDGPERMPRLRERPPLRARGRRLHGRALRLHPGAALVQGHSWVRV
jgi:hypothetical protein